MFIEKLTKEQLCQFFNKKHLTHFMSKDTYNEVPYLYVSISGESMSLNYRLYNFEGSTIPNEGEWRKFLFEIFGNEYKEEYKKYLQKQMDTKLACLDKN